jgi:hypothetical protein
VEVSEQLEDLSHLQFWIIGCASLTPKFPALKWRRRNTLVGGREQWR